MRKLNTSDIFAALRVIKAANLREEIKPVMKKAASGEMSVEDIGIDGILSVVEMIADKKAEKAMYEVLAGPFEMSPDEVASLDIMTLVDCLTSLANENDMKGFFASVSGILGKK